MAANLKAFLKENAVVRDDVFVAVSKRFIGEDGAPIPWQVSPITATQDEEVRKRCTRRVPVPGKKNMYQPEIDYDAYLGALAAKCTVFPNLNDAELQDSYGVKGAGECLKAMLEPGEYYDYLEKVQKINGFDVTMDDKVEEAKN